MPVYKDEASGTWYVRLYYKALGNDGKKISKQKTKRGFNTRKEAKQWEAQFVAAEEVTMNVLLKNFVEMYFTDKKMELKESSIDKKRDMINKYILPYLGERAMNEITPADIIQWQNIMRGKGFADTYLRMIQNQMTALFTHASNIYNLANNPCKKVKKMGKSDADELSFWTREEYDQFIETFAKDDRYYVLFETLFWTGMREGEILALTSKDIDFNNNQIRINKTYYRSHGKDVVTTPKTDNSVRIVDAPQFLIDELKAYLDRLYKYPDSERLFPVSARAVQKMMGNHMEKAGVKKIRVHDLRHSHVAYLIHEGVEPLLIKNRLGHKDIKITLNTYGHLYPNEQKKLAEMLNAKR